MRADRLLAVLLLLQTRGRVTAAEVAAELEVSERTARRDLDALSVAGVPVYATRGRGGGWELLGGGSTDLSGLTRDEARSLFLAAGASSEMTPAVRAALRKLLRALPEPLRAGAEAATTAVLDDPSGWHRRGRGSGPTPALLTEAQRLVIDALAAEMTYVDRSGAPSTRVVHPLGVVAKGTTRYLIADTEAGLRTFRIDRIRQLVETGEPVRRPADFDLAATWSSVLDRVDELRYPVSARCLVDLGILGILRMQLGDRVAVADAEGDRVHVGVRGRSAWVLARELAGFADRLQVIDPPELVEELVALARATLATHG